MAPSWVRLHVFFILRRHGPILRHGGWLRRRWSRFITHTTFMGNGTLARRGPPVWPMDWIQEAQNPRAASGRNGGTDSYDALPIDSSGRSLGWVLAGARVDWQAFHAIGVHQEYSPGGAHRFSA